MKAPRSACHTDARLVFEPDRLDDRAPRRAAALDEWVRYSSRLDALIQMGELIGEMDLDGAGLKPFWPYLWLGQWTHTGKGTVMGLARYRLRLD